MSGRKAVGAHRGQLDVLGLQDRMEAGDQKVFRDRRETKVTVERMDQGDLKVIGEKWECRDSLEPTAYRAITDHLVREVHQDLMDAMELRASQGFQDFQVPKDQKVTRASQVQKDRRENHPELEMESRVRRGNLDAMDNQESRVLQEEMAVLA